MKRFMRVSVRHSFKCFSYSIVMMMREAIVDYSDVRLTDRIGIGVLTRLVTRDLVDEVLAETGRAEKRSRLLPARVVVYYVMALCLFFGEAYEEVMRRLVGGLQYLGTWRSQWTVPSTSAISQARARLGEAPMKVLFERLAVPMAGAGTRGAWYQSWRLMAVDGVVLDVPDTAGQRRAFWSLGQSPGRKPVPAGANRRACRVWHARVRRGGGRDQRAVRARADQG